MIPLRHDIENSPLFHMVDPETVDVAGDPYVLYMADVRTELFSGVSSIASCPGSTEPVSPSLKKPGILPDLCHPLLYKIDEIPETCTPVDLFGADKEPQLAAGLEKHDRKLQGPGAELGGEFVAVQEPGRDAQIADETLPLLLHANGTVGEGVQGAAIPSRGRRTAGIILDLR